MIAFAANVLGSVNMDGTEKFLVLLPYWSSLDKEQKDYIRQNTSLRHYDSGALIHGCGNACLGMIYLLSGGIRVYLLSEEGREITLFRMQKGDPCVLSASCVISQITFDTHMVVEKDCDLLVVNSAAYKRLTDENVYVRCFTYELMTERFSTVMWAMQAILFEKFDRRLAAFLLSEYDRTGSPQIRMTHEQIARHISSAREVVARMLKRFVSDGLVEIRRGSILLKDVDGLRNI